jgi:hypothetical protein
MSLDWDRLKLDLADPDEHNPPEGESDDAHAHAHADAGHDYDGNGNPEASIELPPILDAATFSVSELPTPEELIKGVVHKGTKIVIGGGSKSFKTWVQIDAALSVAYGLSWMGRETLSGRVLFINFEIKPSFFQKRIKAVCEAKGIQQIEGRLDIWNLRGYGASYTELIPLIIARIKEMNYALVIIDPIYKLYGNVDENSANEVANLMNGLERVCVETDAAVMFGAHYSKGNQAAKESIDRISGSGVFARDPDSIIPFTKHEEDDCFVVEPVLRNLPPIQPFVVRWKYPLMVIDEDLDPAALKIAGGPGRKKVYDAVALLSAIWDRTGSNPVTTVDWAKLAGVPRTVLNDYMPEMREKGLIATIGEGRTARKYITPKGLLLIDNSA